MRARVEKPLIALVIGVLTLAGVQLLPAQSTDAPSISMTDARLSWPGTGANFFWQIVASPTDPSHVIACSIRDATDTARGLEDTLYGSTDGGENWKLLKATPEFNTSTEIACGMSGDHTIYFATSVFAYLPQGQFDREYVGKYARSGGGFLWHSPDFGKTWTIGPHIRHPDAQVLAIVKNARGQDRVFDFADAAGYHSAGGDSEDRYLTIFDNNGSVIKKIPSWNPAPAPPNDALHCGKPLHESAHVFETAALPEQPGLCVNTVNSNLALPLGNGLIGALYSSQSYVSNGGLKTFWLTFTRVTEDGVPVGAPSMIADLTSYGKEMDSAPDSFSKEPQFSFGVGPVPGTSKRRVYATWENFYHGRLRVMMATSDDYGATWSAARPIDDAPSRSGPGNELYAGDASIAVNKDGIVGVSWIEAIGGCWRFATSRDGGKTFGASVPMNPCDPNARLSIGEAIAGHIDALAVGGLQFRDKPGDTGITVRDFRGTAEKPLLRGRSLSAAADGTFYALWSTPGRVNDELHATHIVLPGYAPPLTVERKHIIADATCCIVPGGNFQLGYTFQDFDPVTHEVELGAVLIKRRNAGGHWPIVLRLQTLDSSLGALRVSNADNGVSGAGAAFVFDGPGNSIPQASSVNADFVKLPAGQYEYSQTRILRFRAPSDVVHAPWASLSTPGPKSYLTTGIADWSILNAKVELLQGK